jgi:hypothetical protein
MNSATATLIRTLVRQAKGALAAVDKWLDELQNDTPILDEKPEVRQEYKA